MTEMADSVMEIISPSIITVTELQAIELEELKAKVANLRKLLSVLQALGGAEAKPKQK